MATIYVPKGTTDLSGLSISDGDSLVFGEGSQTVAGIDLSGLNEGLSGISVLPSFTGSIGSPSTGPLRADLDSGAGKIVYNAGGGSFFYQPDGDDDLCNEIECLGAGTLYLLGGGTVTLLEIARGAVHISADVVVATIRQTGGTVTQLYKSTANTNLWIEGGEFVTGRGFSGTANVWGGRVVVRREDTGATLPTGATLNIAPDGSVKWMGGNITTVNAAGPIDLSDAPNAMTITNLNISAKARERSRLTSKYAAVTITNLNEYVGVADAATPPPTGT